MELQETEEKLLTHYAQLSVKTKGRKINEDECNIRTCYQRDRDRIIHSKAFRRLKHKTQVYVAPEGDHYRTRLTHTLEVAQIARVIARALKLNEDLVEAISLGHDLGHTPFGHEGEKVLNEICIYGFKHRQQSLRVVDFLEDKGKGLNLTEEVRDGILNHSGECDPFTLEGAIVKIADRIAYINHDIDDSIRANVISMKDLPKECIDVLGSTHSERISTMVNAIIKESYDKSYIKMNDNVLEAMNELRNFLFVNVYKSELVSKLENNKAHFIISNLYEFYKNNIDKLPDKLIAKISECDEDRVVCDYIAGMTDLYAIETFKEIFIPKSWQ